MWIERTISQLWAKESLPIRALIGLRQVGKSSFLQHIKEDQRKYVTLDDPLTQLTAKEDPELFFDQHSFPLIIDECQLAPELFSSLKKRIDQWLLKKPNLKNSPFENSPVWLSGSNQILIDQNIKESLAGRVSYFHLHPLSLKEMENFNKEFSIKEAIIKGGFPIIWKNSKLSFKDYYSDYLRSVIEKDVISVGRIEKREKFIKILSLLAARSGTLLNQTSLSNDAGLSTTTVSEWVDLLTSLGFIYKLKPYFTNLSKRLIKNPKIYFCDTALMARLSAWSDVDQLLISPQAGAIFENLIFTEIIRTRDHLKADWEVFFWRTKDKEEIDFLVENGSKKRVAIEVKLGGGDPLNYQLPSEFKKVFKEDTPTLLVGLNSETKSWRNNIISVDPLNLSSELVRLLN